MLSTYKNKVWISKQRRYPQGPGWEFDFNLLPEGGAYRLLIWSNPHPIPIFPQLGWVGHTIDRCIMEQPFSATLVGVVKKRLHTRKELD